MSRNHSSPSSQNAQPPGDRNPRDYRRNAPLFHFDLSLTVAIAGIIEGLVARYERWRITKAANTWTRERLVAVIGEAMLRACTAEFRIVDVRDYENLFQEHDRRLHAQSAVRQ